MNLAQALAAGTALGLERLDAQLLLLHALGRPDADRAWLVAHDTDALDEPTAAAFLSLCQRRAAAEPLAYLVGHKEFFGLDLKVDARVLVPRPDTETLVGWALEILGCHPGRDPGSKPPAPGCHPGLDPGSTSPAPSGHPGRDPASTPPPPGCHPGLDPGSTSRAAWIADQVRNDSLMDQARNDSPAQQVRSDSLAGQVGNDSVAAQVLDLGTGSGAIALAIKKHLPGAFVEAVDVSAEALEVAIGNAKSLSLQVEFRQACWLAGTRSRYDLIVSNPPYVAQGDAHLPDLRHEPAQALEAGPDGLREIRKIISQAPGHLRNGGWLLLEHGWDQAPAVRALLEAAGFGGVQSRRDLAGIERCSGGKRLETGIIDPNMTGNGTEWRYTHE